MNNISLFGGEGLSPLPKKGERGVSSGVQGVRVRGQQSPFAYHPAKNILYKNEKQKIRKFKSLQKSNLAGKVKLADKNIAL